MAHIIRVHVVVIFVFVTLLSGCGSQGGRGAGEQPAGVGECKLQSPLDIGTSDPRKNYLTEPLITLIDVQFYQKPKTVLLRKSMSEEASSWEIQLFEIFFDSKPTRWLGFYIEPQMSHSLGFGYNYGGSKLPDIGGTSNTTAEGFVFSTSEPVNPRPEDQLNALVLETANGKLISVKVTVPLDVQAASPSPSSGALEHKGNEILCVKSANLKR